MNFEFVRFSDEIELWNNMQEEVVSSFLTSLNWINFQKSLGKETEQFLIKFNNNVVGILYLEIYRRRISKYAYAPHNPLLKLQDDDQFIKFFSDLREFGKEFIKVRKLNYFKIDPLISNSKIQLFENCGFTNSMSPGQAKDIWIIDLEKEDLLKSFDKDTRYYVNRAVKLGVKIVEAESEEQVKEFVEILNETKSRKRFQNFSDSYFIDQWKALNLDLRLKKKDPICRVFLAKFEDKTVSGALINYTKDTLFYSHGGSTSDSKLSKISSPYLLHYFIMKDGKEKGFKNYSMWGVVPKGIEHTWRSMSNFKMKFPGKIKSFTGPFEVHKNTFSYFINKLFDFYFYRNDRY